MYDRIDIKNFRSLQNQSIILGSNITVISGRNSTGKSTILGMLGNSGELKKGIATTYWGTQFRSEFSDMFKGSTKFDHSGSDRFVYTAPTATTARAFCRTLPLTAHGHCAAKYDILDMAR